MTRVRAIWVGLAWAAAASAVATAEIPSVEGLLPAGGSRGSEFEVTVLGKAEPWPVQAVCDGEGVSWMATENKGIFRVRIEEESKPGPRLVWFFNGEGVSAPRQFVVGSHRECREADLAEASLTLTDLPVTINGTLGSGGEVDRVRVSLEAGEVLVAEVVAYALDSPLDPLLHIRDPRGAQLAFNHDATSLGLDPRLVFTAPASGVYEVQLAAFAYPPQANIRFTGGASSIYRLTLGGSAIVPELPAPNEPEGSDSRTLELPATIVGRIDPAGEVDRYRLSVVSGERLRIAVAAAALGSWMDPVLVIRDAEGKEVSRTDDRDSKTDHDLAVDWTAPADGEFQIEVADLLGTGGPQVAYQLVVENLAPGFRASAPGGVYRVQAGEPIEIAVAVTREGGFAGEIEVGADDLPPGVTMEPVVANEKGEARLTLVAEGSAPAVNVPISLWVRARNDPAHRVPVRFDLKGSSTDAGDLLVNQTERGWLTVARPREEGAKE